MDQYNSGFKIFCPSPHTVKNPSVIVIHFGMFYTFYSYLDKFENHAITKFARIRKLPLLKEYSKLLSYLSV